MGVHRNRAKRREQSIFPPFIFFLISNYKQPINLSRMEKMRIIKVVFREVDPELTEKVLNLLGSSTMSVETVELNVIKTSILPM